MQPSTPTWLTPAQPGLITNGAQPAGTSTQPTSFSPPLTVQYRSPGGPADGPVAARYKLTQTQLRGAILNPTVVYDSGWGRPAVGPTGATTPLPMGATLTPRGAMWAEAVGRVYVFDFPHSQVWSAPVSGLSVGSWRAESPPPSSWSVFGDPVLINGQIYALTTSGIVQVTLNGDGTLGSWTYAGASGGPQGAVGSATQGSIPAGSIICGLDFTNSQGGCIHLFTSIDTQYTYIVSGTTGTVASMISYGPATLANLPSSPNGGVAWIDTSWWPGSNISGASGGTTAMVHVILGGSTATYWCFMALPGNTQYAAGTLVPPGGTSWSTGAPLPTSLENFGLAITPQMLSGGRLNGPDYGKDQDIYLFGGRASATSAPNNAVYAISGAKFRTNTSGLWTTVTPGNGWTSSAQCGCAAWPMPGTATGLPAFVIGQLGGFSDANGAVPNLAVQTMFPGQMAGAPPVGAAYSTLPVPTLGPGSVMAEAQLQQDGAYLYSFTPALPSQSRWGGPYDGDQYTLKVDFVSQLTGDPSPPGLTVIDFAKPPSIVDVSPIGTIGNGNPTISFAYQSGNFGGPLLSWRILVTLAGVTIADSGPQVGDTVWTPGTAPCLTPGQTYGLTITASATDGPLTPTDSTTATYSGTFTPQYTMPSPPYDLVCTPNTNLGAITATWTNPSGTAFNRMYYRITGASDPSWWLLQDSIQAQTSMSMTFIDQLALAQSYDFAVTALDATQTMESGTTVSVVNGSAENPGPPNAIPAAAPVYTEGFEESPYTTTLWHSLGTDSLNTLDGWTLTSGGSGGGNTMYANVLRQGVYALAQGGHPDWQDGVFTARFTIPAAGVKAWPKMLVHVGPGAASWVSLEWVGQTGGNPFLRIYTQSPQYTGDVIDGAAIAQTAGNSYWFTMTCSGHNYTGQLFADSAGSKGTLLGTVSGSVTATAVGAGQVALSCLQGEVDWGGAFANVCTWQGAAPTGWAPNVPSGTAASTSVAFTDTFANLNNWSQMTGTNATVASDVVTLPTSSGLLSNQSFGDGVWTVRLQSSSSANNTPWVYVRASGGNFWAGQPSTMVPNATNAVIVQWNPYNNNNSPIAIWKNVKGQLYLLAESEGTLTIAASTWYWVRVIMKGPNITFQFFSDSTGAMGTMLAEVTGYAPDSVLQSGSIGIGEGYAGGAMGGNFSNVCVFQTFTTATGPGEPAFAVSSWEAQAGDQSISVYQPTGQSLYGHRRQPAGMGALPETAVVAVTQGDSYSFQCQVLASSPLNSAGLGPALLVEEYNSSNALIQTTWLVGATGAPAALPPGLVWQPSVVVTAAGSSADYTNGAYGAVLRSAPNFSASAVGSLQEGQPAIVLGPRVADQVISGDYWWPIAYGGSVAYLWTADAPGPSTASRGGFALKSYLLSGSIIPQTTTTHLSARAVVSAPGLNYYDQLVVTAAPDTAPALYSSIGTDALGTLASWTTTGSPTIASHVVTMPAGSSMAAGHADWSSITFRMRFEATNSNLEVNLGAAGSTTGVTLTTTGGSTTCVLTGGGVSGGSQSFASTTTTFFWLFFTVNGNVASYYIVADSGGAPGTTVLASATVTSGAINPGLITISNLTGGSAASIGGAFPQVCTVYPLNAPADWAQVNTWTSWEPAFAWDTTTSQDGDYSLSISAKVTPGTTTYWVSQNPAEGTAVPISPNSSYTFTGYQKASAANIGKFEVLEWSAAGSLLATHSATGPTTSWAQVSLSFTSNASAAYASIRALQTATGTIWFDDVLLAPSASADNQDLGNTIEGPPGTAIVHLAGNNGANVVPMYFGTYMKNQEGGPQVTYNFDSNQIATFGNSAPIVRTGALAFRSVQFYGLFFDVPTRNAWLALRNLSFATATPLFMRDYSGRQLLVMQSNSDHQTQHEPSNYNSRTDLQDVVWEIPNTVSPYTDAAYVLGLRALVDGSLPALSTTEDI